MENPLIRVIEKEQLNNGKEDVIKEYSRPNRRSYLTKYPVVYIYSWLNHNPRSKTNEYCIYVGETNDINRRCKEHLSKKGSGDWEKNIKNAKLYVIGHSCFNKSLTLDIENRFMRYFLGTESVKKVANSRSNPQEGYYPDIMFETLVPIIWKELQKKEKSNKKNALFQDEEKIKTSVLFQASPLHKLTEAQYKIKTDVIKDINNVLNQKTKKKRNILFVEGEAGTGKTVLISSMFFDLLEANNKLNKDSKEINLVINHEEQLNLFKDMCNKFGLKANKHVFKSSTFINNHTNKNTGKLEENSVDVVFVDEAHLLLSQRNQGYTGSGNQFEDIIKIAKVCVIIFDENQILRGDQYWDYKLIEGYKKEAHKYKYTLKEQLRMQGSEDVLKWIYDFTINKKIDKIPSDNYEIKICDTPKCLETDIKKKANDPEFKQSRLIATFDWDYNDADDQKDYGVQIEKWYKPWNYKSKSSNRRQKKISKKIVWVENEQTIDEVGSVYTVQGFDLNYAGVILGESVKYNPKTKKIYFDVDATANRKVKNNTTGVPESYKEKLLQHEVRVLMTRGVNGLYIYACNKELREALQANIKRETSDK